MTTAKVNQELEPRTVVIFDICSSTAILEGLVLTEHLGRWRDLLIRLKEFIESEIKPLTGEVYKFLGDGWVLLFPSSVTGIQLLNFLEKLADCYGTQAKDLVVPVLESTPAVMGLTFGVDCGRLVALHMNHTVEYVGRAINVAARLQNATKEDDRSPAYKLLMSKAAYNALAVPPDWKATECKRSLRNIRGNEPCECMKIHLGLAQEITDATQMTERTPIAQSARSENKAIRMECPACHLKFTYQQKMHKNDRIKAIKCPGCGKRLYLEQTSGEFTLKLRKSVPEKVLCPCGEINIVRVDPVIGSSVIQNCKSCGEQLRVYRTKQGVQRKLVRLQSPKLTDEFLQTVKKGMGSQPWPHGRAEEVARQLGVPEGLVRIAVQMLIRKGVFKPQIDGILYVPEQNGKTQQKLKTG